MLREWYFYPQKNEKLEPIPWERNFTLKTTGLFGDSFNTNRTVQYWRKKKRRNIPRYFYLFITSDKMVLTGFAHSCQMTCWVIKYIIGHLDM